MKLKLILLWVLRLVAAAIMLQTLYFKFTAHPQSVRLFTEIGLEPVGRIVTGVFELIASILLLLPRYTVYGAVLGCMMMTGAIYFHLTKIGINFGGDPVLFIYALTTFACCAVLVFVFRSELFAQWRKATAVAGVR